MIGFDIGAHRRIGASVLGETEKCRVVTEATDDRSALIVQVGAVRQRLLYALASQG